MQIEDSHLDTSQHFLDLISSSDPSLQKAIMRLKVLHPTYLQSYLFSLPPEKLAEKNHFYLSSPLKSGKTVGIAMFLINHILERYLKKDSNTKNKVVEGNTEIPVGIFAVYLCSSRETCSKNAMILQELLHFVEKPYKLTVRNLMETPEINLMPNFNYVLVATPTAFLSFQRNLELNREFFKALVLEDAEFLRSFGYFPELLEVKSLFKNNIENMLTIISSSQDIDEELKGQFLKKCVKISIEDNEDENQEATDVFSQQISQVNQIFHTGPPLHKSILLYLCFKLKLIFGKTIILCKDVDSVYKTSLFLKRTGFEQSHVYNTKDPKNLRSYIVSVFNSGLLQTIITTFDFFDDIQRLKTLQKARDTEEKVWKKIYLNNLQNIIIYDFAGLESEASYMKILGRLFKTRTAAHKTLISLIENGEQEIDMFTRVFEKQKKDIKNWNLREFPLKNSEIDAFNYRIKDVLSGISRKHVKQAQMLDFKRQMLKSKNLNAFFEENKEEKKLLQEEIKKISNDLNKYAIRLYEDIPDYLFPESLKEKSMNLNTLTGKKRRLTIGSWNEGFKDSLRKRMENNGLQLEDVKKNVEMNEKKLVIDEENEKPETLDPNYLKPLSNRKQWKIKHKFSLKKRNKRLEKKGIFQS